MHVLFSVYVYLFPQDSNRKSMKFWFGEFRTTKAVLFSLCSVSIVVVRKFIYSIKIYLALSLFQVFKRKITSSSIGFSFHYILLLPAFIANAKRSFECIECVKGYFVEMGYNPPSSKPWQVKSVIPVFPY